MLNPRYALFRENSFGFGCETLGVISRNLVMIVRFVKFYFAYLVGFYNRPPLNGARLPGQRPFPPGDYLVYLVCLVCLVCLVYLVALAGVVYLVRLVFLGHFFP